MDGENELVKDMDQVIGCNLSPHLQIKSEVEMEEEHILATHALSGANAVPLCSKDKVAATPVCLSKQLTSPERWEIKQLISSGALDASEYPNLHEDFSNPVSRAELEELSSLHLPGRSVRIHTETVQVSVHSHCFALHTNIPPPLFPLPHSSPTTLSHLNVALKTDAMPLATSIVYGLIDALALTRRPSTGSPTSTNAHTAPPLHHNDDANSSSLQLNHQRHDIRSPPPLRRNDMPPPLPPPSSPLHHGGGDTMSSRTTPPLSLRHEDSCIMARTMLPPQSSMSLNRRCYMPEDDDAAGMNGVGVRRPAPPPSSLLASSMIS
ncbi:hypothetical protein BDQ17DRAFT_1436024 [Cyathus striatus]|nr:hypothetical protein BDQ17DRAFT_1436024 [Cyathus striatus]